MDVVAKNVGKLKELFPKAFTGGKVNDRDERYSFICNSKNKAWMIAQTPSTRTLRHCKKKSVCDSTQNVFIISMGTL